MSDSEPAVDQVLRRVDDVLDAAARRERAAPVDARLLAALAAAAGPGAPLAQRSVGDRVRRGLVTWDEVWRDPYALGPEAVRVVQTALVALARSVAAETPSA